MAERTSVSAVSSGRLLGQQFEMPGAKTKPVDYFTQQDPRGKDVSLAVVHISYVYGMASTQAA